MNLKGRGSRFSSVVGSGAVTPMTEDLESGQTTPVVDETMDEKVGLALDLGPRKEIITCERRIHLSTRRAIAWCHTRSAANADCGSDHTPNAPPSLLPAKKYCDITGLHANYTDPRTKLRYKGLEVWNVVRSLVSDLQLPCRPELTDPGPWRGPAVPRPERSSNIAQVTDQASAVWPILLYTVFLHILYSYPCDHDATGVYDKLLCSRSSVRSTPDLSSASGNDGILRIDSSNTPEAPTVAHPLTCFTASTTLLFAWSTPSVTLTAAFSSAFCGTFLSLPPKYQ